MSAAKCSISSIKIRFQLPTFQFAGSKLCFGCQRFHFGSRSVISAVISSVKKYASVAKCSISAVRILFRLLSFLLRGSKLCFGCEIFYWGCQHFVSAANFSIRMPKCCFGCQRPCRSVLIFARLSSYGPNHGLGWLWRCSSASHRGSSPCSPRVVDSVGSCC